MNCPACKSESEMAYSALSHGFVCTDPDCGLELELDSSDVEEILAAARPANKSVNDPLCA